MIESIKELLSLTGIAQFFEGDNWKFIIMIAVSLVLVYLAIVRKYEPLLLLPIAAGMLLANLPGAGVTDPGGLLSILSQGMALFPPLIFLGVGAITDFGPIIANPKTLLFGGAAQVGIFAAFLGAIALGFAPEAAAAIGIIGSADGPTTIYLAGALAPEILGTIAIAAYSYMALVPIIQPPIMRALTTKEERAVQMDQLREVSKREKIIFALSTVLVTAILIPQAVTLIGMLMIGNLIKESGVAEKLTKAVSEYLMYILIVFIGLVVGSTTKADTFLTAQTIGILALGLFAFALSTASGVLFGKLMCKLTRGKINPLIGAAGVSAMPMSARVVQKVAKEENPDSFLLMHTMGPTVASTIGSAIVAGVFLSFLAK